MRSSLTLATMSLLASVALATDLSIFLPGVGSTYAMDVSVKTANPSTTVVMIPCPTKGLNDLLANQVCGTDGISYSIISTTIYQATLGPAVAFTCDHKTASKEVSCDIAVIDLTTIPVTYTEGDFEFITASVTGGEERLSASQTGSVASTEASTTSGTASGATQASGSVASAMPTGAAYKYGIEGSALLALAGAAALNAW